MTQDTTYVGLDAHKDSLVAAMLVPDEDRPVEWSARNDARGFRRLVTRIRRQARGQIRVCYEAGPFGFALQRKLIAQGLACSVIAPSLIPRKPGEQVKTDRRDARKLVELFRAGLLTEVVPPSPDDEAARDLCRARDAVRQDLLRCRHRVMKYLLRRDQKFSGTRHPWTVAYRAWLQRLRFEREPDNFTLGTYLLAVDQVEERLKAIEERIANLGQDPRYVTAVGYLRCFRGIDTITAVTLVAELYDPRRFASPRQLMAYLGLVPREHSSGVTSRRGKITKAGNSYVRRLLVEAAWSYRHRAHVSKVLRDRRANQPPEIISLADRAQVRLHRRYWRLATVRGVANKAAVAVARELTGFIWVALQRATEDAA